MKIKKIALRLLLTLPVLLAGSEAAVRLAGMIDFPIYHVDQEIGYIPKPSQAGEFLNKNSWVFNDRSMGVAQAWAAGGGFY